MDKDSRGRFTTGNKAAVGKGRPKRYARYLQDLTERLTPERWKAIVDKAITQAEGGDKAARAFLADYALGKPQQHVTVESEDSMTLADYIALANKRIEEVEGEDQ